MMRRILADLANQRTVLALCVTAVSACGGVQFDREPGVERLTPLPTGAEVLVVGSMKEVPSGSQVLGVLHTRRTQERFVRALAEKQLSAAAAPRGCDLLADVHEQKFDGAPRKSGGTIDEYEWLARCIRTSIAAEAAAAPPPPAPVAAAATSAPAAAPPAKEEPKYKNEAARLQAEVAAAKDAAKKAAKLAAEKEEALREYAENAEKEKKKAAAAEADRQKKEKEQAEKEKQRAANDAADKARAAEKAAEKAHAAADSAEKERKKFVAEASEKAKIIAEAPTPANFKAVADAGERVRVATENAEKAKQLADQADKEAKKAGEFAQEKAKSLDNEKARAEALERERKVKEDAERRAREESERKAKEDAERKAKDEAERKAKEEAAKAAPGSPPVAAVPVPAPVADRAAAARAEREAKAAIAAEKKRQDAERKRLDAEAKRQEAERRKAEAAEKKRKGKEPVPPPETDADLALKDGSINALLAHLALRNDTDPRVAAALDKRVAEAQAEWVTVEGVVVSTVEDERGPKFDADVVAKDVEEAHALGSKFLTPREYSYRYTLRNPAARPVAVDVELPGQRLRRVLNAGQQVVAQTTVPCIAHGSVAKRLNGSVLEYHFECNADSQARIVAVRPVERELLLDKRAADADVPLDVITRIWQALPGTALTSQYLAMVDDIVRRRGEALADFQARLAVQHKTNPDAPTPGLVTVRNASQHDATVLFDVGNGKEQRLIIPHGQTAEMKLDIPAGVAPELKVLGVLPRLRTLDWLLGVWSFKGARMALVPAERGQWTAFLVPTDGGRVTAVGLHVADGVVQARANVPAAFVKAIFGADTPGSCEEGCEVRWLMRVADFDQYVAGAGRALQVEMDAADRHAVVKFAAEH